MPIRTNQLPRLSAFDLARFFAKVNTRGPYECWPWRGAPDVYGYGRFSLRTKTVKAHRVMYALARGPIGEGKLVCHSCDNPICCNPAHLFLGTTKDNLADAARKGRVSRGEHAPKAKLLPRQVQEIRAKYAGGFLQDDLAAEYGVYQNAIHEIVTRKSWKHVP